VSLGSHLFQANEYLDLAKKLYIENGDLVGWSKTLAGKLFIGIELNLIETILEDAAFGLDILLTHRENKAAVSLMSSQMKIYKDLGQFQKIVDLFSTGHSLAQELGTAGEHQLAVLNNNVGEAYLYKGQLHNAKTYFSNALDILTRHGKLAACQIVNFNLAFIELFWGNFQKALEISHAILEVYRSFEPSIHTVHVKMQIAECYLNLNRYGEIISLAEEILALIEDLGIDLPHEKANIHRYLAISQVELNYYDKALNSFEKSEAIFEALKSKTWTYDIWAWKGELAFRQHHFARALELSQQILDVIDFEREWVPNYSARVLLTQGKSYLALGAYHEARAVAARVAHIGRRCSLPSLRYKAHMLLGQIALEESKSDQGRRHYKAASLIIQQIQKQLTITLQREFWDDKSGVLRALVNLDLQEGKTESAFQTLEDSKSQVLRTYIANHSRHQWLKDDPDTEKLIEQLEEVRQEHHFYYRIVHEGDQLDDEHPFQVDKAQETLQKLERRLMTITERLYLSSASQTPFTAIESIKLADVQARIKENEILLEYYNDGKGRWSVFVVDAQEIEVVALEIQTPEIIKLIEMYQFNLRCAAQSGLNEAMRRHLYKGALKIGQKFFDGLIAPAVDRLQGKDRLTIVPYGLLHYLPFNAFYAGDQFLIELHEIVMLPAAGLKLQSPISKRQSARVLAHAYNGRLPFTLEESRAVSELLSGEYFENESVTRDCLRQPASQILHIAAHGKHRLDQPHLSYIQMADGQLFPDDLLQSDLSYELVVLSACETGRAMVKEGEELIGLSQSVMCAGAGALLASLWQVEDRITSELINSFYNALLNGQSKAAALQGGQKKLLAEYPDLHPLYWAAFQLTGNPAPLSHLNS
ncbi:MAG: CHAT domain-containing tetratricopeptide repeat protein, partial [Chloroflexota bacterium]